MGRSRLECLPSNRPYLPENFGGNSGGGLWRLYFDVGADGAYEPVQIRLCGIATYQSDETRIVCQE